MDLEAFGALVESYDGVRRRTADGKARWELDGRMVARELAGTEVVVRSEFDVRDQLVRRAPEVFSVPSRYARHMNVVVDLAGGDDGAVEDAVAAAVRLQRDP